MSGIESNAASRRALPRVFDGGDAGRPVRDLRNRHLEWYSGCVETGPEVRQLHETR
jgi:hypothetical protein